VIDKMLWTVVKKLWHAAAVRADSTQTAQIILTVPGTGQPTVTENETRHRA